MNPTVEQLRAEHERLTGAPAQVVWAAPGRVNLIGEHTDYNDGFVLPFALAHHALVSASARDDRQVVVRSLDLNEDITRDLGALAPFDAPDAPERGWWDYLVGCVWALQQDGLYDGGVDLVLASDVPVGAGLSSSAAIECAGIGALLDLVGAHVEPMRRAELARKAENLFVGAPTGILDQAASTLCTAGNALFLDCRSLATEQVPMDLDAAGLEIVIVDTRTPHSHVDGEYAARRASCDLAAQILGVPALRDVTDLDAAVATLTADPRGDQTLVRRVRHVVTEDQRVLATVELARAGDFAAIGPLMTASHASMRDDFEITVETVDLAVRTALAEGALGARMTGGGFGGCILALVEQGRGEQVGQAVAAAFADAGFGAPAWFSATPQPGARRVG